MLGLCGFWFTGGYSPGPRAMWIAHMHARGGWGILAEEGSLIKSETSEFCHIPVSLWRELHRSGGKLSCVGGWGGGGVRAPFSDHPPLLGSRDGEPLTGRQGRLGGILRYPNIHDSKRSPQCADFLFKKNSSGLLCGTGGESSLEF